jgi:hypothetical protein
MGETSLRPLKAVLETIREQADFALISFNNRKKSVQCGGNAKAVDTLSISHGPFHWKRLADIPGAKAFRFNTSPEPGYVKYSGKIKSSQRI